MAEELNLLDCSIDPKPILKSEIDTKAEELKQRTTLPKKPGDRVSFDVMCEWLKLLDTPEKQERVLLYVYRVEPVINRQLVDPQANNSIDVISDGFDKLNEQYFYNSHGGGKYKIIVFDAGNKDLQRNGFFSATLNIPMLDCPPKLDLREVVWSDSKNKGYQAWCRGQRLIDDNNMPTIEKKDGQQVTADTIALPMVEKFMSFFKEMNKDQQEKVKRDLAGEAGLGKEIGTILVEQMKQQDPSKMVAMMVSLMQAMQPKQQTDPMASILPFLTMMQASNDKMFQMFVEMNKKEAKPEVDELDKLEKLLNVAQKIKGGGHVSEKEESTFDKVLDVLGTVGPQVFGMINNILAMNAAKNGISGVNVGPVPNVQQAEQPIIEQPQGLPAPMTDEQMKVAFQQFSPLITKALNDGKEGFDFADEVSGLMGEETIATLANKGETYLIGIAKGTPAWEKLVATYGEPHLTKWLHDFVHYKEIIAELEAKEEEVK